MRHRSFVLPLVAGLSLLLCTLLVVAPAEASPAGWQADPGGFLEHVWEAVLDWWSGCFSSMSWGNPPPNHPQLGPGMDPDG